MKRLWKYRFVWIHIVTLMAGWCILSFIGLLVTVPSGANLIQWDATWLDTIREYGYLFVSNEQSNVASFPLFPYLWRWSHLGGFGISLLNACCFFLAMGMLKKAFDIRTMDLLIMMSVPCGFFFFVPYSEATFFLFGTMVLVGYRNDNKWLLLTGLFLCSLSRSSSMFFIPAIVLVECLSNKQWKAIIKEVLLYSSVCLAGIALVTLIQWQQTDEWFAFAKAQGNWYHSFQLPSFPLSTWSGTRLLWLDGIALWACLMAVAVLVSLVWKRKYENLPVDKPLLFSLSFLAVLVIYILFYSTQDAEGRTSLLSLNRYAFATPFFMLFLLHILRIVTISNRRLGIIVLATGLLWILLGAYQHMPELEQFALPKFKTISYFALMTLYVMTYPLFCNKRFGADLKTGVYCLNIIIQLFLFDTFIGGHWVG